MPLLGDDDETANFQYVKQFLMEDFHLLGQQFGVEYAEAFRYIGPDPAYVERIRQAAMQAGGRHLRRQSCKNSHRTRSIRASRTRARFSRRSTRILPTFLASPAGLCAKLMAEGYTGYLIRTTNDETSGGQSSAQNILSNETEHANMAKALGFKDVFEFYYCSHRMNEISPVELRGRLVFLFRMVKADTVLSFSPSSEGEPDSDHWITGRAVEEACWTAGLPNDFHEHFEAGIHAPRGARAILVSYAPRASRLTRLLISAIMSTRSWTRSWSAAPRAMAMPDRCCGRAWNRKGSACLFWAGTTARPTAAYAREFLLDDFRTYAKGHGFEYAERFYYSGPPEDRSAKVEAYVQKNAVKI